MFKVRYRYFFILLLGIYSFLNIRYTVGDKLFDFEVPLFALFLVLTLVVLGIWELNRLAEIKLPVIQSRLQHKVHPLITLFIISVLNVAVTCFVVMEALYPFLGLPIRIETSHLTLLMAFGFRVNLFLNCINAIVYYMDRLKKTQLEAEQLKKESIEAQFEALRNQINPHFLFNCFNVLSTLVYKDADTSAKFIDQLSKVYRYLLYNQDKKVVPLNEELEFIESYLYLLKIRFGDNFIVQTAIDPESKKYYIAPAVLQMLVENAIKHNVVSRKNPLQIAITSANSTLIVSNNLQEKPVKEESSRLGLKNIQRRYVFLSHKQVVIEKTANDFSVKIPLLEITAA